MEPAVTPVSDKKSNSSSPQNRSKRKPKTKDPLNTPMIRQYLELKAEVPEAILFFRMGDFYEMFLEDAEIAAPILGIQLTSRNKGNPDEVPLCGFPHHQLEEYVAKMVTHQQKVAIGEQFEQADAKGKKSFYRKITRVITPAFITQGEGALGEDAHRSRYLLSLWGENTGRSTFEMGLSFLDIRTGDFWVSSVQKSLAECVKIIQDEIERWGPSEVLYPKSLPEILLESLRLRNVTLTPQENSFFTLPSSDGLFSEKMASETYSDTEMQTAWGSFQYAQKTQRCDLSHVQALQRFSLDAFLRLDASTRRNLELTKNLQDMTKKHSLYQALDHCLTRQGSRLLEQWISTPCIQPHTIEGRHHCVGVLLEAIRNGEFKVDQLKKSLKACYDLQRISSKISLGSLNPRDCIALQQTLFEVPEISSFLEDYQGGLFDSIKEKLSRVEIQTIHEQLDKTIDPQARPVMKDGGFIAQGFHDELDELRLIMKDTKSFIAAIETDERERTGISSLKVRFNKVFGYYIEISKSFLSQVPEDYIRKQTLVNAERFIVPELKKFEDKLLHAETRAQAIEVKIFQELRQVLLQQISVLHDVSEAIAELDLLLCFAQNAFDWNYQKPKMTNSKKIQIMGGRHPVLEQILKFQSQSSNRFIPNDLSMSDSQRFLLITGPNMAGKSTIMRQIALITIMAQMGSYVPAESAEIGIVDAIFTRVGASDALAQGQSTFMMEMSETANILENASDRSLIILDEIGRGTSTFDGVSIAWAVAEHIHSQIQARTLFATHYHELASLPGQFPGMVNYNVAVKEWNDQIIFLRKLTEGSTNRSYGIEVARLAGVPQEVVQRSRDILKKLQEDHSNHFSAIGAAASAPRAGDDSSDTKVAVGRGGQDLSRERDQLGLFSQKASLQHKVVEEIARLSCDRMTPLEALNLLVKFQKKIHKNSS